MNITVLKLNIENRQSVEYIYDNTKMHKLLCEVSNSSRNESKILYKMRNERNAVYFYIQSDDKLDYIDDGIPYLKLKNRIEKSFIYVGSFCVDKLLEKTELRFHLTCSPSKKRLLNGKHKRSSITDCEERIRWVTNKLTNAGALVRQIKETSGGNKRFSHIKEKGARGYIPEYNYIGVIEVVDKEKLYKGIREGFGAGKCYGLGLLMVQ